MLVGMIIIELKLYEESFECICGENYGEEFRVLWKDLVGAYVIRGVLEKEVFKLGFNLR